MKEIPLRYACHLSLEKDSEFLNPCANFFDYEDSK
jgi:hypothetical protein